VISPGNTFADVDEKVFDWLNSGTRIVMVVSPRQRAITVYRSLTDIFVLGENDTLDGRGVWLEDSSERFIRLAAKHTKDKNRNGRSKGKSHTHQHH
jgi:hypothetical protein